MPAGFSAGDVANLSFNFASVAALPGTGYSAGLRVTGLVCNGCGNVELDDSSPPPFTLSGDGIVLEPASRAMMIAGFGLVGKAMRRRNTASAPTTTA